METQLTKFKASFYILMWNVLVVAILKLLFPFTGLGFIVFLPLSFLVPVFLLIGGILFWDRINRKVFIIFAMICILGTNVFYFPSDTLKDSPRNKIIDIFKNT